MPIYEYVCQSCQHRFEVKQRFSDAPVSTCVRCGQAVTKVISAPAIMFKGSGWYITDYSDKLKAPGQSDAAQKPANGQGDQKSVGSGSDSTVTPPSGASGSDSTGSPKAPSTSPSTPPASSSSDSSSASSGKTSG